MDADEHEWEFIPATARGTPAFLCVLCVYNKTCPTNCRRLPHTRHLSASVFSFILLFLGAPPRPWMYIEVMNWDAGRWSAGGKLRHLKKNTCGTTPYSPDALPGRLLDRWSFTCMSAVNSSVIAHTHTWDNPPGMGGSPGAFSHFENS